MLKHPKSIAPSSKATRRVPTPEDLAALREELAAQRRSRNRQVIVSSGTCGESHGSPEVVRTLREELASRGLTDEVLLRVTGCHGFCAQEPMVVVQPGNIFYCHVRPQDADEIVSRTVARGEVVDRLTYSDPSSGERWHSETAVPFYAGQDRPLLGQNQKIDPTSIDDAIAGGAYSALARVLAQGNPRDVADEIIRSGLRGSTGNGLPVGQMWEDFQSAADGLDKYVVCSVDERDPAANVDRTILEANPHAVLEGMILGAYATGATAGLIRLRTNHRLALQHAWLAVDQAREYGLLGADLLDSGFSFDIDVTQKTRTPARKRSTESAAIVSCGGLGRFQDGFALGDGAETWARISGIVGNGALWFTGWGFGKCTGTKIFSLSGPIKNAGFVEVPLGTSLRTIVLDIGGGIRDGGRVKAVQIGGPSGNCLPLSKFNLSVDYDSLPGAGATIGSGGIVVMGRETCMVDVAKRSLEFLRDELCGRCAFCRRAMGPMLRIVAEIVEGRGRPEQLKRLRELAGLKTGSSVCALAKTAANPVLSTLRYFRNEYEAHIQDGRCPAGVCRALVR